MRTLIVAAFISLDGVMQAPGGPQEDTRGGFAYGGWIVPYAEAVFGQAMQALFSQPFELLLGRRTYDIFASYWPKVKDDTEDFSIANLFNSVPKHVATHSPDPLVWSNSHALGSDVTGAVRALKQQDGATLLTQGSAELVQQLLAADLVDELHLLIHPLLLGHGRRLFGSDAAAAAFTLQHSQVSPKGVIIARYLRAGKVQTGSFELPADEG
ncbi:dihydrofolate reductase family protein [Pseudomonas putida]|uniref:dihydrofolate reductase family protein n=1 Tax=Pseudomonas putida TaxID=303 RepID=UPI000DB4CA44|nr:dihydrofolate reductase family protein [Pseudomonas putida]MBI6940262.1 dihydrofolate reductase family protein [Pseudomonas putida]MBI6960494.1 dihydrofolate reductase family protein [Pseudomonas putida]PZQ41752.1 MAG: dihydrofolate reductase [Pseudomonas putida]